jgi:hypothetical protein
MIEIVLTPHEETRTAERVCYYFAACEVDGQRYEARKRQGADNELARTLVAAGIADQPVRVTQAGQPGYGSWRSLHRMALFDYAESPSSSLRMLRWKPLPDFGRGSTKNSVESGALGAEYPGTVSGP